MAILDFTKITCHEAKIVDLSTKPLTGIMHVYGDDDYGEYLGDLILDRDHPTAVRCHKANRIRNRLERILEGLHHAIAESQEATDRQAAFAKYDKACSLWATKLDWAWDEISACRAEFRHLFN